MRLALQVGAVKLLMAYARLYGGCLLAALTGIGRNAWTLALPMGLFLGYLLLGGVLAPLGFAGGILLAFARAAAMSAWCYFTGEVVAHSKVGLGDFGRSIRVYLWSWVNLSFVLYILDLLVSTAMHGNPQLETARVMISLMSVVVLNAAPEVITQKGTRGGLDTIQVSFRFLQESWIEWFVPNGLLIAAAYFFVTRILLELPPTLMMASAVGAGAILHVVMVFRGHLFRELDGSTHRQRMYRLRA